MVVQTLGVHNKALWRTGFGSEVFGATLREKSMQIMFGATKMAGECSKYACACCSA